MAQPETIDSFHCERQFVYQGKAYPCDSNVQRDAERLRPLLLDTPSALAELDDYQKNRQNIRTAAYVGSVGLFVTLAGILISREFTDSNGNLTNTGTQIRSLTALSGLSVMGISVVYGLLTLHNNESHIDNAVRLHNEAHPDTPITLQFSTKFSL